MKRDPHEKPHGNPHGPRKPEELLPPDKTPVQSLGESEAGQNTSSGVHDSNHEGLMTLQPMLPVWLALPRRQGDEVRQNTSPEGSLL
jgi:hypothetical protein